VAQLWCSAPQTRDVEYALDAFTCRVSARSPRSRANSRPAHGAARLWAGFHFACGAVTDGRAPVVHDEAAKDCSGVFHLLISAAGAACPLRFCRGGHFCSGGIEG
jgi:hypothetical protein